MLKLAFIGPTWQVSTVRLTARSRHRRPIVLTAPQNQWKLHKSVQPGSNTHGESPVKPSQCLAVKVSLWRAVGVGRGSCSETFPFGASVFRLYIFQYTAKVCDRKAVAVQSNPQQTDPLEETWMKSLMERVNSNQSVKKQLLMGLFVFPLDWSWYADHKHRKQICGPLRFPWCGSACVWWVYCPVQGFIRGQQAKGNKMQMSPSAPLLPLPPPPPQVRPGAITKKGKGEVGGAHNFSKPAPLLSFSQRDGPNG